MYMAMCSLYVSGVAPGGMQQVAAAYSLAAVVKQHLQQGKLLRGQGNILPWRVTARACQSIFKSL